MLALAFGLINSLITAVMERVQELGMLRALGMRAGAVVVQVVIESELIVLLGLGLGILASLYPAWRAVKLKPLDAIRR